MAMLTAPRRRPVISVVIPTRNRAALLRHSIGSVLRQTVRDIEIVIVDEASSDETPAVIEELVAADPRVRGVRHDVARGAAAARNTGVQYASGDVVAFNDDDCIWHPEKLERLYERLTSTGAAAAFSPIVIRRFNGITHVLGTRSPDDGGFRTEALTLGLLGPPAYIVRRDVFLLEGGFDPALKRYEDYDLWLRIWSRYRIAYCPEPMVWTAMAEGGLSTNQRFLLDACEHLWQKHSAGAWLKATDRSLFAFGLAYQLLAARAYSAAVRFLRRSITSQPSRPWVYVRALGFPLFVASRIAVELARVWRQRVGLTVPPDPPAETLPQEMAA